MIFHGCGGGCVLRRGLQIRFRVSPMSKLLVQLLSVLCATVCVQFRLKKVHGPKRIKVL